MGRYLGRGDGTRLKSLTRKIAGDERPKQFCSVLGKRTLLEETRSRVALEIARERTLYVVNRVHEPYYAPILRNEPARGLVVQPGNRGTAPAILYSLMRIAAVDPEALVAFFPSDHYISDDEKFMSHIRTALNTASQRSDLVILLGLDPETPEVEYGWIEPSAPIRRQSRVYGVRRFWEKPNPFLAQVLQLRGCLWNSFVMVASIQALLKIIESAIP
jgi:mannose-1-phosphate guanylyltransferase